MSSSVAPVPGNDCSISLVNRIWHLTYPWLGWCTLTPRLGSVGRGSGLFCASVELGLSPRPQLAHGVRFLVGVCGLVRTQVNHLYTFTSTILYEVFLLSMKTLLKKYLIECYGFFHSFVKICIFEHIVHCVKELFVIYVRNGFILLCCWIHLSPPM